MSTGKAVQSTRPGKPAPAAPQAAVQEALQVTWTLKGHLKNAQVAYLRVGVLLAKVRDKKLYAALHHPDLESYAAARLHLGRTSLYKYLRVYDWIAEYHKEWLEAKPKGFIPDLADAADMIWIERALAQQELSPTKRTELQELLKMVCNLLAQSTLECTFASAMPGAGCSLVLDLSGASSTITRTRTRTRTRGKQPFFPPSSGFQGGASQDA